MSIALETLTPLSKFRNHIAVNNVVVDYIKDSDIDWLDLSKPFIPFVSWLETGHKALVDYPKELLSYSKHKLSYPLYTTMDMGSLCSMKVERTNVVYHSLIYNGTSYVQTMHKKALSNNFLYSRYTPTRVSKKLFTASGYLHIKRKKFFSGKKKKHIIFDNKNLKNYIVFNKILIPSTKKTFVNVKFIDAFAQFSKTKLFKIRRRKQRLNFNTNTNKVLDKIVIKEAVGLGLYAKNKKLTSQKQYKHKRKFNKN